MAQRITFTTEDGVLIVGNWVTAPTTIGGAILLHMYPATKESWSSFQSVLSQRGIASLAIDLRGHGESTKTGDGGTIQHKTFTEEETKSTLNDVRGAFAWIRSRGIEPERIAVIGASIGANLALSFLADEPRSPAAVLLSPGLNYHGLQSMDVVDYVAEHQHVWIAASREDDEESVKAGSEIADFLNLDTKAFKKLKGAGHGTNMLEGDGVLMGEVADWLRDRIQETSSVS